MVLYRFLLFFGKVYKEMVKVWLRIYENAHYSAFL